MTSSASGSVPQPSSVSSPPFASPSVRLSAIGSSPTTQPISESCRGWSKYQFGHFTSTRPTRSLMASKGRGSDRSFGCCSDRECGSGRRSGSTRGTLFSMPDSSGSEFPRLPFGRFRSVTTRWRRYGRPLSQRRAAVLVSPCSSPLEAADGCGAAASPMPFRDSSALMALAISRRTPSGTGPRHSCWPMGSQCGSLPSSSDIAILLSQAASTPTLSQRHNAPQLAHWSVEKRDRDSVRVLKMVKSCVQTSDCGSEGYGFKPRRPPHHFTLGEHE